MSGPSNQKAVSLPIAESDVTDLVSDLSGKEPTLGFTPENVVNKNAVSGYAGLSGTTKLTKAHMQEVMDLADLADAPAPTADLFLKRNAGDTAYEFSAAGSGANIYGDGSDDTVTFSSNTDLGSANNKQYVDLTINSGITLQADSGFRIRITGTLTFGSSTSIIHVNGKGAAGGLGGNSGAQTAGGDGDYLNATLAASGGAAGPDDGNRGQGGKFGALLTLRDFIFQFGIHNGGGGGGGTPETQNDGANGAGWLSVYASKISGTGKLQAKGDGAPTGQQAGGGGGAGCMITIFCGDNIPAITIDAEGGKGGDATTGTQRSGSGGEGGLIMVMSLGTDSSTKTVTGGAAGSGTNPGSAGANGVIVKGLL